jgi:predicted GTPase
MDLFWNDPIQFPNFPISGLRTQTRKYENLGSEILKIQIYLTFFLVNKKEENIEVLAVSSQASQPVVISMSHGDGTAILSTTQISVDTLDDELNNEIKELLTILLNFLGVTCGNANKSILTNAYLLGDDKVII